MDLKYLDRIVQDAVQQVMAQRELEQSMMLPPSPTETVYPNACKGPVCGFFNPSTQPSIASQSTPQPQATISKPNGPAILSLLSGAKEKWDVISSAFLDWRQKGIHLDGIFSSNGREIIGNEEIQRLGINPIENPKEIWNLMYDLKRYSAVFLPSMSRNSAAKLALGITDNLYLNVTIAALAQQVPVYATEEGLLPTACIVCGNNVPGIQDVLQNYRNHLGTMGMRIESAEETVQKITRIVLNITESGADLISTLITEEDAETLPGPVVKVSRGGLITPLALDVLQRRGIEVVIVPKQS